MNKKSHRLSCWMQWMFAALEAFTVLVMLLAAGLLVFGGRVVASGRAPGTLSLGEVRVELPGELRALTSDSIRGRSIELDQISGVVAIKEPGDVSGYVNAIRLPGLASILFVGGMVAAICELLRRVFRQVGRGEAFAAANVRRVSFVGVLMIVLTLGSTALGSWTQYRAAAYMKRNLASTGLVIDFSPPVPRSGVSVTRGLLVLHFNPAGVLAGLVVVALAEAFRQGMHLKEENDLTV